MVGKFDAEGFLQDLAEWTPEVAAQIAHQEGLVLTPAHWEIITEVRRYHAEFGLSPINRTLVRYIATNLGAEKGNSIYLLKLFAGGPAKVVCKIAGLPRPTNCL